MPVERIYIAHIKGCNINLKKYGPPSYRQVKLFPQADNYRLGVSKSYQLLSTLTLLIETGNRHIVDTYYFSAECACGLPGNRSYQKKDKNRFPDFGKVRSCGRRCQGQLILLHSSSIYITGFKDTTQIFEVSVWNFFFFLKEQGRLGQPRSSETSLRMAMGQVQLFRNGVLWPINRIREGPRGS